MNCIFNLCEVGERKLLDEKKQEVAFSDGRDWRI